MKLKLVDIDINSYETEFGTCELCMSVGYAYEPTYYFEKDDGMTFHIDGYYWSWGDLDYIEVDNVIEFAAYINSLDFDENTDFNYSWLNSIVEDYYNSKEE